MLKESYLANMKNLPKGVATIVVTRRTGHILSPSWNLLSDYKDGKINWEQYVRRFNKEMDNEVCRKEMRKIKVMAETQDVYLICYEKSWKCHRFLLLDMIEKLDKKEEI
jgi:uncharacterized protein YeaO (DUF488 family)